MINQASPLQHWHVFAPYLDGISYEMAAHRNTLKRKDWYKLELDTYAKMMEMGKSIFLYTYARPDSPRKAWDPDGRKVAITAMLVMPANNPHWGGIYISPPTYEVWPTGGWAMWPEQLGKPLGVRKWSDNIVTREFENGLISVTTGAAPEFSIKFNY